MEKINFVDCKRIGGGVTMSEGVDATLTNCDVIGSPGAGFETVRPSRSILADLGLPEDTNLIQLKELLLKVYRARPEDRTSIIDNSPIIKSIKDIDYQRSVGRAICVLATSPALKKAIISLENGNDIFVYF